MKTTNNTIFISLKKEISSPEVDFEMYDDILGKDNVELAYENDGVNLIENKPIGNYPISIEYLKRIISTLEEKGCNYISIDYNCDHPDYTFYGLDVHQATKDEISEKEKKEKEDAIKYHENRLKSIDKKRNDYYEKIKLGIDNDYLNFLDKTIKSLDEEYDKILELIENLNK